MKRYLLAGAALMSMTSGAHAAANLVGAELRGLNNAQQESGTVWNTTVDSFYTLFLASPVTTFLNPNDEAINKTTSAGQNNFNIFGDGWPLGTDTNSDPFYRLRLTFEDGAVIDGVYSTATRALVSATTAIAGNTQYAITGFGWERVANVDTVSGNTAVSGGSASDYTGQFSFNTTAVPEPATWAMMITGFGFVGSSMRRRAKVTVSYAAA